MTNKNMWTCLFLTVMGMVAVLNVQGQSITPGAPGGPLVKPIPAVPPQPVPMTLEPVKPAEPDTNPPVIAKHPFPFTNPPPVFTNQPPQIFTNSPPIFTNHPPMMIHPPMLS